MFRVELHQIIVRISSVFYQLRLWPREDGANAGEMRLKFLYSFYHYLLVVSVITGVLGDADINEIILLVEFSLMSTVVLVKLLYIVWWKKEILSLLNRICVYSVDDDVKFAQVKRKLAILIKFVVVFYGLTYLSLFAMAVVIPFLGSDKTLFLSIGFPLDWNNNEFAYWMAFIFLNTQICIVSIAMLFSAIVWYLMTNCGLRFDVLGQQIKTMGEVKSVERIGITNGRKISDAERDNLYLRDLLECIASHTNLKELTNELESFLSELFVVQLAASALPICCSIYCLAFNRDGTSVEYIVYILVVLYNIFEIFLIMNFGNEIELASDRLSYALFESDWMDRPQSTKKVVLIFGEFLMRPHQLVVLKLYPLNLQTFMRILNSAYSSFNILKNFK